MSLHITKEAAAYLLVHVTAAQMPIRLSVNRSPGRAGASHKFECGARQRSDDTVIDSFGVSILCDFFENPEFEHASVEIRHTPGVTPNEYIVVVPKVTSMTEEALTSKS
jgi:Fe-S cluster assembly iron-binding protein IscA